MRITKENSIIKEYMPFLPDGYSHHYMESEQAADLDLIKRLSEDNPLEIAFYHKGDEQRLKLFQYGKLTALSKILPEFDRLGIFVNDKLTFYFGLPGKSVWMSDFSFNFTMGDIEAHGLESKFKEALIRIWNRSIENDKLNSLIFSAQLSWQEVIILRSYSKYLLQLGLQFAPEYIEDTIIKNSVLASDLINLFRIRFNPRGRDLQDKTTVQKRLEEKILKSLDNITNLDQDRIMRSYYTLINATVRTNFFQCVEKDHFGTLVLKFDLEKMPNLAPSGPKIDSFVYSVRFEGIHRRSSKVARGGIRWSDRMDFSTEILGLMRTQTVKNSVIVPTGAKGGFFLKNTTLPKNEFYAEGVECYKMFIASLLSITDNRQGNSIKQPEHLIAYDGEDPYFVVAADKGTANFSDTANTISKDFGFWLDDAFASGGRTGYNHKKMGITAKGAWESVKRHFLELDINIYSSTFTVIGIGDMSGDVFGNGLLLSENAKLIAAFDHRHIFIDPNPADLKKSFNERLRLFNLPSSSWQDYAPELISQGGGVFSRQLKSIPLTPEIQKALDTNAQSLSPNELIRVILKAPVDLLWNGGIGTFFKASFEGHEQAADNTNRSIRINGNELRCKVVGEGGNLGFTQNARIQYAQNGGKINTDFIDNVGGVDCSDREVNIKIVLNSIVQQGAMTFDERNELLHAMEDEVAALVLKDAHDQALAISLIEQHSKNHMGQYTSYLNYLEKENLLNREEANLPNNEELIRRQGAKQGLLRPHIAILLAHTKILVKELILKSNIPDDPFLTNVLQKYFPKKMRDEKYLEAINNHLLNREIIATTLSNNLVNRLGVTYLYTLHEQTGASFAQIVIAFILIHQVFALDDLQNLIESLHYKVSIEEQYEIFARLQDLAYNASHWFLYNESFKNLESIWQTYREGMEKLYTLIPTLMVGTTQSYMLDLIDRLGAVGMSKEMATRLAGVRALYAGLNIIHQSSRENYDLETVAKVYFYVGQYFGLVWFRDNLFVGTTGEYWDNLARSSLRNKFDTQQRRLTKLVIKEMNNTQNQDIEAATKSWVARNKDLFDRWFFVVANVQAVSAPELSMFFVSAQELAKITRAELKRSVL